MNISKTAIVSGLAICMSLASFIAPSVASAAGACDYSITPLTVTPDDSPEIQIRPTITGHTESGLITVRIHSSSADYPIVDATAGPYTSGLEVIWIDEQNTDVTMPWTPGSPEFITATVQTKPEPGTFALSISGISGAFTQSCTSSSNNVVSGDYHGGATSAAIFPTGAVGAYTAGVSNTVGDNIWLILGVIGFIVALSIIMALLDMRSESKALEKRGAIWKQ